MKKLTVRAAHAPAVPEVPVRPETAVPSDECGAVPAPVPTCTPRGAVKVRCRSGKSVSAPDFQPGGTECPAADRPEEFAADAEAAAPVPVETSADAVPEACAETDAGMLSDDAAPERTEIFSDTESALTAEAPAGSETEAAPGSTDAGMQGSADNVPYSELYRLDPGDYSETVLPVGLFPRRVLNRLAESGIFTAADLLHQSRDGLCKCRGLGVQSADALEEYLQTLSQPQADVPDLAEPAGPKLPAAASAAQLPAEKPEDLAMQRAYAELDRTICTAQISGAGTEQLQQLLQAFQVRLAYGPRPRALLQSIPAHRLAAPLKAVLNCYTDDPAVHAAVSAFRHGADETLGEFLTGNAEQLAGYNDTLQRLVQWCAFDLGAEFDAFLAGAAGQERERAILSARAAGKSLETIGKSYEVTRERVRQIEKKICQDFDVWLAGSRFSCKLRIELGGGNEISADALAARIGPCGTEFVYLLSRSECDRVTYDKVGEVFYLA